MGGFSAPVMAGRRFGNNLALTNPLSRPSGARRNIALPVTVVIDVTDFQDAASYEIGYCILNTPFHFHARFQ